MPRNGDGSSDNGPIEGHNITHGSEGSVSFNFQIKLVFLFHFYKRSSRLGRVVRVPGSMRDDYASTNIDLLARAWDSLSDNPLEGNPRGQHNCDRGPKLSAVNCISGLLQACCHVGEGPTEPREASQPTSNTPPRELDGYVKVFFCF